MFHLNKSLLTTKDITTAANYGGQDIFLFVPFLSEELYYDIFIPKLGRHNESLYTKWFYTGKNFITETDITDCKFSILPFKFDLNDNRVLEICNIAKQHNKKVIAFFTDDNSEILIKPDNLILFRTSVNKSTLSFNDRVMPALHPDHFSGFTEYQDSISFCGQLTPLRYSIINELNKLNLPTNFIPRQGFWAPEVSSKVKARKDYYKNLLSNKYALCIRGSGNFSFRFYEALCFGRIPILVDTDTILPFSSLIDWSKHIIFIKQNELSTLPKLLEKNNYSMIENRKLWKKYFSIEGYSQNFIKDIDLQ